MKDDYYLNPRVASAYDAEQAENEITVDDIPFYVELAQEAAAAGHSVLELGCGTGRVTIPIAQAGVEVVGLDSSPQMLEVARRKSEGIENLRWVEGDMASFALGERFGLVIIPFRSFLLLHTREDQEACLRCIRNHLVHGGRLALNFFNPDPVRRSYEGSSQEQEERRIIAALRASGEIISHPYRNLRMRYVFRYEMEHLLTSAGFHVDALYGWFDRRPYDDDSAEMVWLATKA
jgi:SAM-dependent methyltransferase